MKTGKEHSRRTLTEITLLSEQEFIHLEERVKERFDYPLHRHPELELNFIEHFQGLRRVVGDSVETVKGDMELVLIGSNLAHRWEEAEDFVQQPVHEITIQFSPTIFEGALFRHIHFAGVRALLTHAEQGVCFGEQAVAHVLPLLRRIATMPAGFDRMQMMMKILHSLGSEEDYRLLSTGSFSDSKAPITDSERIEIVTNYIRAHFTEVIRLEDLASMAYMSPTAFSSFFHLRTHKRVSDFIIDERIGYAIRALLEGRRSVSQICYDAGFQNVSNFNRQFKKRRGCTPRAFRDRYRKGEECPENLLNSPEVDEEKREIRPKKG